MQCRYTEIVQRIFKYSDVQYTSLTPDKILNSLVYRTLFYVNIYWSHKLLKTFRFLAHPVYRRFEETCASLLLSGDLHFIPTIHVGCQANNNNELYYNRRQTLQMTTITEQAVT